MKTYFLKIALVVSVWFAQSLGLLAQSDLSQNDPSRIALNADLRADVMGGRVSTLVLPDQGIEDLHVTQQPRFGRVSVNPDKSLALVLTGTDDQSGALDVGVAYTRNGADRQAQITLNVQRSLQTAGWAPGLHYMLETNQFDDVIVEHGANHRKVFVTRGQHAWTAARIAARENIKASRIKTGWLVRNPLYGSAPQYALSPALGMQLWSALTSKRARAGSHWLLFERGYSYEGIKRLVPRGAKGASALHPHWISAYGQGARPVLDTWLRLYQDPYANIVVSDVKVRGVQAFKGRNLLLDDVAISGRPFSIRGVNGLTIRNSEVTDVTRRKPTDDHPVWRPFKDRLSGMFASASKGMLIEGTLFDHNGWSAGYDYNMSGTASHPPSMFSHNVYIQYNNVGTTFRNNIAMRGASYGAQIRPGGMIEGNVFLDNNAAVSFFGGNYDNKGFVGNYTLFTDNVITSAAHKEVAEKQGALSLGLGDYGNLSTLKDSIIVHLADPDNAREQANKQIAHRPIQFAKSAQGPFYDDTIVFNWASPEKGHPNRNSDTLNADALLETTIQRFAAEVLGRRTSSIGELATYFRSAPDSDRDDLLGAKEIVSYFQNAFARTKPTRSQAGRVRFVPNGLSDGIRWDNRLNWTGGLLPGTFAGDAVDLAGNHVSFGGTVVLRDVAFGNGGGLAVTHGMLRARDGITSDQGRAEIFIDRSGQFWTFGARGAFTVDARGGRFANTGQIDGGTSIRASEDAQVILATSGASLRLSDGDVLHLLGRTARVGFDGVAAGPASLVLDDGALLRFTVADGGLSRIGAFYSGRFGTTAQDIASSVSVKGAVLRLDLAGLGTPDATRKQLILVDQLSGMFSSVEVSGLGQDRDATVTVDNDAGGVVLDIGARGEGSGEARVLRKMQGKTDPLNIARIVPVQPITDDIAISWLTTEDL